MKGKYQKKPEGIERICRERISELFIQAGLAFPKSRSRADRYVEIARKISMKHKVRISPQLRKQFCSKCHSYLSPSVNCRVRVRNSKVIYSCKECGHFMRFPYVREKKAAKKQKASSK